MKKLKVMFGNKGADYEYKIGEVNIANKWNPKAESGRDFGGFNYASEECILRWIRRGDTIYDVELPSDAEMIKIPGTFTPNGLFRANKIIVKNPRKLDEKVIDELYKNQIC